MYRTALVALKPHGATGAVVHYAVALAQRQGLRLAGISVIDEARLAAPESMPIGAGAFKKSRDAAILERARQQAAAALDEFQTRSRDAGVECSTRRIDGDVGDVIARAVQRCDVLLLGHARGSDPRSSMDVSSPLHEVLKRCPRPAIVVPADSATPSSPSGVTLVAYDGSLQAARALASFVASGWFRGGAVRVAAFHADPHIADSIAQVAVEFLRSHEVLADGGGHALDDAPADAILRAAHDHGAELLVMGAYGRATILEFFFGSVTRQVLERSPIPVFVDH